MPRLRLVWICILLVFPGFTLAASISDCLLNNRVQTTECAGQIIRFESQYSYVSRLAQEARIDPVLILAVIAVESGYSDLKLADRGGIGPIQITPIATKELGIGDLTYLLSDTVNVQVGTRYLQKMMQKFADWRLALAAYNAGPSAVIRHKGIPPYRETQTYVQQVMWWYLTFKHQTG